jgi:hypothetical protein
LELFKRNPSFWVSLESDQLLIYLRDAQVYVFKECIFLPTVNANFAEA